MTTVAQCLKRARDLQGLSESPRLDVELLLGAVLNKDRTWLFTWPETVLSAPQQQRFEQLLLRRLGGEPIAHILGEREFWSLPLAVNASTLIPRPDTEALVEAVLQLNLPQGARVLDLGTGTGAIALALASEQPGWQITAVDVQADAVALAQHNRERLGLANVTVRQSDWFSAVAARDFDVIVSNPPYIEEADPHLQQGDVRFEPRSALTAGRDGLVAIRHIVAQGKHHLRPGGHLVLEHGYQQAAAVQALLREHGYCEVQGGRDLGGNERFSRAQLPRCGK